MRVYTGCNARTGTWYDILYDGGFIHEVAGLKYGEMKLMNGGGYATIEISLPLDGIDPDSDSVVVDVDFFYFLDDDSHTVKITSHPQTYLAALDGLTRPLSEVEKIITGAYLKSVVEELARELGRLIDRVKDEATKDW